MPAPPPPQCIAYRYIQPAPAASKKPPLAYCRLREPMSDLTVTRLSYTPVCVGEWKPPKKKVVPDNLKPKEGTKLETYSTTQLDFPYWGWVPPRHSLKPCARRMQGDGCISDVTTSRADYTPQHMEITRKVERPPAFKPPPVAMEGWTTMRSSYTVPACPHQRASFKPPRCFRPCEPFEETSVARMSYLPWPLLPKEVFPWMKKPVYQPPTKKMNAVSMYSTTFIPPGWFQKEPCVEEPASPQLCVPGCSDKCPPQ